MGVPKCYLTRLKCNEMEGKMNISIIGLGYVGVVCSACFAKENNNIIGVDVDSVKIDLINSKRASIVEKDLEKYIVDGVENGRLEATTDLKYALENSNITIISVGTPSHKSGNIDLTYIKTVAKSIGKVLKSKKDFHIVSMRSTVLPGTAKEVISIIENYSDKKVGVDFGYVSNPEFLRESTAIWDFYNPPKTVVGVNDDKSRKAFRELYSFLDAPYFEVDIEVAEMIKYADNSWHAVKVTFANEIGLICKQLNIDSHKVMDIFCSDTKLNISTYYLKPGFAFGGSCLPKDVKAIAYKSKLVDENTPLLNSLMESNTYQINRIFKNFIKPLGKKDIGILGISFKANTDDLRESPVLELVEILIGKGYNIKIYDKAILSAKTKGINKYLLENELPHINLRLMSNINEVIGSSDVLIIGNSSEEFKKINFFEFSDKFFIDLVRISSIRSKDNYVGISW